MGRCNPDWTGHTCKPVPVTIYHLSSGFDLFATVCVCWVLDMLANLGDDEGICLN